MCASSLPETRSAPQRPPPALDIQVNDAEWLHPDQAGPPPWRRFQKHRPVFANAVVLACLIVFIAIGTPSGRSGSITTGGVAEGPPPADRQLLWFAVSPEQDPFAVHLDAYDWSGNQVGRLVLPCRGPCSFEASPDGQRVLVSERPALAEPPIPGLVYDARGRRIGTVADPAAIWADDSRHLCLLRPTDSVAGPTPNTSHADLDLIDPERGQVRVVASVAGIQRPSAPAFWGLIACSFTSDRAVVGFSESQALHDLRVLELSTGRTLYARDDLAAGAICGCSVATMYVGADANLAIENLVGGGVQMRSLSTGATARWPAAVAGVDQVLGLSWGGRLALVSKGIIEVASGRLVWRVTPGASVGLLASRPASDDVLLYLARKNRAAAREVIVQGDGRSIPIPIDFDPVAAP